MGTASKWRRGILAAVAASFLALPAAADAAVDETVLLSRDNGGMGDGAVGTSTDPSISADGCRVSFSTTADNIAFVDPTAPQNVVMRDHCAGGTQELAIDDFDTDIANEFNSAPVISADGCRIAFWTTDSLDPDDPDPFEQGDPIGFAEQANREGSVYVRDVCNTQTILVSRNSLGASVPVSEIQASISADGDLVAFATRSHVEAEGGIDDGNPGGVPPLSAPRDVYLHNVASGETFLVSTNAPGTQGANGDSLLQGEARNSLSDSGRFISMHTTAGDLQPGLDFNGVQDIYVKDLQTGGYERATLTNADKQLTGQVTDPTWAMSGNGRRLAFTSASPELGGNKRPQVWLRDLDADTTELISRFSGPEGAISATGASRPALDDAGRLVAFASGSGNLATFVKGAQVFVRDTLNQTTHAVSRRSGHLGALSSGATATEDIAFNGDGRFLAFGSSSPGLAPGDANGGDIDVFRRELLEPGAPRTRIAFNARPIATGVSVNTPGSSPARPLETVGQLPVGSLVDATRGRVAATTTGKGQSKPVQTAEFYGARFRVTQRKDRLVLMKLKRPKGCGKARKGSGRALAAGPVARAAGRRRGLWGSGKGRFGTRGRRGAGTVRGTIWYVEDRCDGSTFFRVKRGVVAVDDFGRKGKVDAVLRKGDRYVAGQKRRRP